MKKYPLMPLQDRIIVRLLPEEEVAKNGIVIPNKQEKHARGFVVAVGPGRQGPSGLVKMTVKVGDTVLFDKGAGQDFKIRGDEVVLMFEGDLIGIFS